MLRKINLGCGVYRESGAGWINIDINPRAKPDIVRDVRRGLPFDDNSAAEVQTSHFLEHLDNDSLIFLVGEIYRVLGDGGAWSIVVPVGNTGDLDHKMQFTPDSFDSLLRPENADYFQTAMQWREVPGSRRLQGEPRPSVKSLVLKLQAVKGGAYESRP